MSRRGAGMLGVVFDLDGTLVDSLDGICVAAAHAVERVGRPAPTREAVSTYIGMGVGRLLHRSLTGEIDGVAEEEVFQAALRIFSDHYLECCMDGTYLRQDALDVLGMFHSEGRSMAVLTNKPSMPTRNILQHLGILDFFNPILSPEEVGVRKPDPRGLKMAIEVMGVDAGVMVGDSLVDLETAEAAGVPFVGIRGGYHAGADLVEVVSPPHRLVEELGGLPGVISTLEPSP